MWYVLQTKPHKETSVARSISALLIESFLPRIIERVHGQSTVGHRQVPMFPSYLFVNADIERWGKTLRYTPGARDFLRCDGTPQPLDPAVISIIRTRTGATGVFVPPPPTFESGDRLRIEEGLLQGVEVIFERDLSGPERVAVLLAGMKLAARVVLHRGVLAKA